MIIDIESSGSSLSVSHYTEEGEVNIIKIPIPKSQQFVWQKTSASDKNRDKEWESWDGYPVKKHGTYKLDRLRIMEILESFDPQVTKPFWDYQTPKKYFVDIEVEITDNRADSLDTENAKNRILSVGMASSHGKILVMGLEDMSPDRILTIEKRIKDHFNGQKGDWTFNYRKFESEFDMLYTFLSKLVPKMPLITGWNWFGYDWPYIINRCKRLGIDPKICSPSSVLLGKNQVPQHILMVDYLEIYKKWDRVIKIRESNSLDYVATQAIGIKKIHYQGSLKDLYESDFETFIFYNAVDCALVHYIDQRLDTLSTFFKIAGVSRVEISRALSPVWTTEVLMLRKFLERKKVIVSEKKEESHVKFEGAYVKKPDKGLYEWIACFDFASLYPNTMIQWGISPEIYLGKNLQNIPEGAIKTSSGAVFFSKEGKEPVLREILQGLYNQRKSTKKKYFECEKEIEKIKKLIKQKS
jgi:DNA polymerase elongation subunit (family B)